jgi:hypothetical protein
MKTTLEGLIPECS